MGFVKEWVVVKEMHTLHKLAKAKLIELHAQTGKKVGSAVGGQVYAWYIDEYTSPVWEFEGVDYRIKWMDGCFCPFVMEYREVYKSRWKN